MRRLAFATAVLLAPALTGAQPHSPRPEVAFTGPTRTYTVAGCGDGPLSAALGAPSVRIFCLDGTATVGVATDASGYSFFQTVLDLTGTRVNGFAGRFYDIDYSNITFSETVRETTGQTFTGPDGFGPPLDVTGHTRSAYVLLFPVSAPGSPDAGIPPDGITFGPTATAQLGYLPPDAPGSASDNGHYFPFGLTVAAVTAVPEPTTLALTAGGLVALGAGVRRRRRAV